AAASAKRHSDMLNVLKGALGGIGFAVVARNILQMADAHTNLQNKLQNVATSQAQVNQLTDRLYELANRTRSNVDATAQAFVRFDRSMRILGKSQEDTFRMTETVNKG